jgi:Transglutaminase-like superfamily
MRRLASWWRLPSRERRLLALAWVALLVARVALRVVALDRCLIPPRRRVRRPLPPDRIARLVEIAARRPPKAGCLPVSLVTAWLLARQGTPATLRVGVARHAGELAAHAWLEYRGAPLLDACEGEGWALILGVAVATPVPGGERA